MPADIENRDDRHREILRLLRGRSVRDQSQLVALLRESGFDATQPSVSRDLRDLGIVKVGGRYVAPRPPRPAYAQELEEASHLLRGIKPAGPYLTVAHTAEGAAQVVGFAIDHAAWPEVVGTIAGDDTLFLATAHASDQRKLLRRLTALLQGPTP